MKRVFLETYGCQMNVADSELMAGVLERAGLELTERPEDADAILLNTCAIREHAEQRVLGRLGEFARLKARRPGLVVGVAGCMAQHLRRRRAGRARAARSRRNLWRPRAQTRQRRARMGHGAAGMRQVLHLLRRPL